MFDIFIKRNKLRSTASKYLSKAPQEGFELKVAFWPDRMWKAQQSYNASFWWVLGVMEVPKYCMKCHGKKL